MFTIRLFFCMEKILSISRLSAVGSHEKIRKCHIITPTIKSLKIKKSLLKKGTRHKIRTFDINNHNQKQQRHILLKKILLDATPPIPNQVPTTLPRILPR